VSERLLKIYLQDHLAGATAGLELARRCRASNPDGEIARALDRLIDEIAEDRQILEGLMERLGFGPDRGKLAAAWVAEKVGRLKPNGAILGYSPLSRLEELEALSLGVEGKLCMWRGLKAAGDVSGAFAGVEMDPLIRRAQRQRRRLENLRAWAAVEALASDRAPEKPASV
jgi:hypothetical protein